jgi:hypothetical protein
MKEQFISQKLNKTSLQMIAIVNQILDAYAAQGFDLSLRQLYYQLVAQGYIENSQASYKRTGDLVNNARLAGLVDWAMIQDRGRSTVWDSHWSSPAEIVQSAAQQFKVDKWADQPYHLEIMVEKQALEGVLIPVCQRLDVRFTANKGYSSSSMMYEVGQRIARQEGKKIVILYLGDHDPSGMDMTRDVEERLRLFSYDNEKAVKVERLALNMDQVKALHPPENPAKETDSRYGDYIARYGGSSWELDAIEPAALAALVEQGVTRYRDETLWQAAVKREQGMKNHLAMFASTYKEG